MASVRMLIYRHIYDATTHGDTRPSGARTPVHAFKVLCPQRRPEMKEDPPGVESCQERAAEGCDHSGSHRHSRSCVARGILGGGDLGKQVVQGPCWTDPLCSQANPVGLHHPWEAPTSPSTRRRSGRSSLTFKSSEPFADSWSQDTGKQPRGMRGTAAKLVG